MSLIRKHGAVLQAWAYLALVIHTVVMHGKRFFEHVMFQDVVNCCMCACVKAN